MPVFNGELHLKDALDSIIHQTHKNWALLISDNNSSDNTGSISLEYARKDSRIKYVRQAGIKPADNFYYCLENADCEYFAWHADDDIWEPDYLSVCMSGFDREKDVGLVFTGLEAIDDHGTTVRACPDLPALSGKSGGRTVAKYLMQNEIGGKANFIYGVLKKELAKEAWNLIMNITPYWGQDMCFVLAVISRGGLFVDKKICFKKRYSQPINPQEAELTANYTKNGFIPYRDFLDYCKGCSTAVSRTPYRLLTMIIMLCRLIANTYKGFHK